MRFLTDDREKALQELNCYLHSIDNAFDLAEGNEFSKAAAYYEKAAHSLRELQKMKDVKQKFDKQWLEIKQVEGQQVVDQWIMNLRNRV